MFRKVLVSLLAILLSGLAASPAPNKGLKVPPAPSKGRSSEEAVLLRRCWAEYRHITQLGAPAQGILQDCLVDLGDKVKAGQVLGRIQDVEQRAELERAKFEAGSLAAVRTAESRYNLARTRHRYARALFRKNAIGKEEYEVAQQEEETARLVWEEAKVALRLAELRYKQAEAAVRAREIVSPHDGIVVQILKREGEAAIAFAKDPIFRVVNTESLRVTGSLDAADIWRVRAGQSVRVTPELAGAVLPIQTEVFTGQVVFVDSEIDPQTRTCRVVAEVKNREGLLRAGLELQMEVLLATTSPANTAAR